MRHIRHQLAALLATACLPASALAAPTATLHVALYPMQLGHDTNLAFRLHINTSQGLPPTPVTQLELSYPSSLGIATGELGLTSCPPRTLEEHGANACPQNSVMGRGHAIAEMPFGPENISEAAEITVLRAPEQQGHIGMYFFIETHTPLYGELIDPGILVPGTTSAQETLRVTVPLLRVVPEGPYASLTQLNANIGASGLTYHENNHGHFLKYKPTGILLPTKCPHNGFQFNAHLTFITGTHTNTRTRVPCPVATRSHKGNVR